MARSLDKSSVVGGVDGLRALEVRREGLDKICGSDVADAGRGINSLCTSATPLPMWIRSMLVRNETLVVAALPCGGPPKPAEQIRNPRPLPESLFSLCMGRRCTGRAFDRKFLTLAEGYEFLHSPCHTDCSLAPMQADHLSATDFLSSATTISLSSKQFSVLDIVSALQSC